MDSKIRTERPECTEESMRTRSAEIFATNDSWQISKDEGCTLRKVLQGEQGLPPPLWIMRQAGRYLPEYRDIRKKFPDFMEFCLTPEAVTTVTLQPIDRFDFDAAIIFCDILIIPHVLGQTVQFIEGEGPRLAKVDWSAFLESANKKTVLSFLEPVFKAIASTRQALPSHKSLIGFCGSPWTIACYMMQGGKVGLGLADLDYDLTRSLIQALQPYHPTHFLNVQRIGICSRESAAFRMKRKPRLNRDVNDLYCFF